MQSNEKYQNIIQVNRNQFTHKVDSTHNLGRDITELEIEYHKNDSKELVYASREDKYKKDMADMIEYVKWITN